MKKAFLPAVILSIIIVSMFAVFTPKVRAQAQASETVIFQDNFESYPTGPFNSVDGWKLVWGAYVGDYPAQAIINDTYANSGNKSLESLSYNNGVGHCSSIITKDCSTNSTLIGYEAYVMTLPGGSCGVGFFNQPIALWGRFYAGVGFSDAYIWAGGQKLQPYTAYQWYKIRLIINRSTRVFNVWVNDQLEGRGMVEPNDPWEILSLQLGTDFNHILPAYFDDVKVFTINDTTRPIISNPEQNPPDNTVNENQNVTVATNVTDSETGVGNVTLSYGVNGTTSWVPINMTFVSGDTYQATIPAFANGTKISYRITAYDLSGNQASNDNQGNYYVYTVPEFPYLLVLFPLMVVTVTAAVMFRKKGAQHKPDL